MASFEYYRIFYYTAVSGSMTKAASLLHSNQPNVTRCINSLENELHTKLFLRSHYGITLTPQGRELFDYISPACERIEQGEKNLLLNGAGFNGTISIGVSETALRIYLLPKLNQFHKLHKNISIRLSSHSTPDAISQLSSGSVDFALVTTPLHLMSRMDSYSLVSYRESLIGGNEYKEFSQKVHHLKDFADIPFITLEGGTGSRDFYIQYFMNHHASFRPSIEAATSDQILPIVRYNLGIGFYPESLASDAARRGQICVLPLAESLPERKICLVTRKISSYNKASDALIEFLER